MDAAEVLSRQITELDSFARMAAELGTNWFIFGVTANAAAAWTLLSTNVALTTNRIPSILFKADCLGATVCGGLAFYYYFAFHRPIEKLTALLPIHVKGLAAAEVVTPFPFWLYFTICVVMGGFLAYLAWQWHFAIQTDYFQKRAQAKAASGTNSLPGDASCNG